MDNKILKTSNDWTIALRIRDLIRIVCSKNDVEILSGHVGKDHIHLLISVSPYLSASKLVQYMKGYSSRKLQMEYKELTETLSVKSNSVSIF